MDSRAFARLAMTTALSTPTDEARCRTAISRAYYGAFLCAVEALDALNAPTGNGPQSHGQVPRLLQRSGDNALVSAGGLIGDLHRLRRRADYEMAASPLVETQPNALKAAQDALQVIGAIDAVLGDPTRRAAARAAIRAAYQTVTGNPPA